MANLLPRRKICHIENDAVSPQESPLFLVLCMYINVVTLSKLLPRFKSDYSLSPLFAIVTTIPERQ